MGITFYKGAFPIEGNYISDLPCHVLISQYIKYTEIPANDICSFAPPYKLFHLFVAVGSFLTNRNYEISSVLILVLSQIAIFILMIYFYKKEFKKSQQITFKEIIVIFSMLFIVALPFKNGELYLPQGSPNVWHNPTYIFLRPFSIVSFFSFYSIYKNDKKLNNILIYIIFSISTLLSTYAKPSFSLSFLTASGIIVLISLIKNRFKNFKQSIKILLSVVPSLLLMIYQYMYVSNYNALNTGIKFGTFLNLNLFDSIISTFCALILPLIGTLLILKYNYKKLLNLVWLYTFVSWIQYYFLYQINYNNGDFAWGYFLALFITYYVIIMIIMANQKTKFNLLFWIIYFIQTMTGIIYFYTYFKSLNFMANFNSFINLFY